MSKAPHPGQPPPLPATAAKPTRPACACLSPRLRGHDDTCPLGALAGVALPPSDGEGWPVQLGYDPPDPPPHHFDHDAALDACAASEAVVDESDANELVTPGRNAASCRRPPPGWLCSRGRDHSGPCAATRAKCCIESARHWECDLEWGHEGDMHASAGDGYYNRDALAGHKRRQSYRAAEASVGLFWESGGELASERRLDQAALSEQAQSTGGGVEERRAPARAAMYNSLAKQLGVLTSEQREAAKRAYHDSFVVPARALLPEFEQTRGVLRRVGAGLEFEEMPPTHVEKLLARANERAARRVVLLYAGWCTALVVCLAWVLCAYVHAMGL